MIRPRLLLAALAVGLAYAGLYEGVSTVTSFGSGGAGSTFWPAAGLTLAVLLVRPRREWPLFLAAVAAAELSMNLRAGIAPELALSWVVANTAEPALAATVLRWRGRPAPDISRPRGVTRFVGAGVILGPLLGGSIGALSLALFDGASLWPTMPRWFVGDAVGALVVAPALLVIYESRGRLPVRRLAWTCALLLAVGIVALGPWDFTARAGLPFLVLPILMLAVAWARTAGAAIGMLIVALIVEAVTASNEGPFAADGAFTDLVAAQMFLVMSGFTALLTAAVANDLVSRDELEARLRKQALHDPLTGLANRRLFFDRLGLASRRLERYPGRICLLFIDLDSFKLINDHFGHVTGDAVLVEVGDRLRRHVRSTDTVARLGGDEFALLATDLSSADDADLLARRVERALSAPVVCQRGPVAVRASVGVALADNPVASLDAFVQEADLAMYRDKRSRTPAQPA